jgi:hypothetical protein
MAAEPPHRPRWLYMGLHAVLAAVVFFAFNRFVLGQTFEISLAWGAVAAPGAAYIAWREGRRA